MVKSTAEERFAASWEPGENGCHVWSRTRTKDGYGSFWSGEWRGGDYRNGPVMVLAHRWVYERTTGLVLSSGSVVRHFECDNPPCVNFDHLREGTQRDNVRDAIERGRHANGRRMLTDEEEARVRASYTGKYGDIVRLAAEFEFPQRLVARAVRDLPKSWGRNR